ncbi:hypothetical protein CDAR_498651 [Caerostris darwini]|uniref:Uncharacterized protein n=1 Tax=Caerostris darwini TaxID=1538125 RepID=A0AAV4SNB4_9ARAC|nr:hypothetical protein CDAR_498651 [Caerostris darwini]
MRQPNKPSPSFEKGCLFLLKKRVLTHQQGLADNLLAVQCLADLVQGWSGSGGIRFMGENKPEQQEQQSPLSGPIQAQLCAAVNEATFPPGCYLPVNRHSNLGFWFCFPCNKT